MLRHSRYVVAGCGAMFAAASFLIGLEVSATTAAPSLEPSAFVNRALKGDRLSLAPIQSRNFSNGTVGTTAPRAPAPRQELLEGCEPIVSAIGQPPLSRVPGRCLS